MRTLVVILFITSHFFSVSAQTVEWKHVGEYTAPNIKAWGVDPMNQLIFVKGGTIYKLDTNFHVLFTQSDKNFGAITSIDASHSLKTLVFSEDQQQIGILDNTLTYQKGRIDVSKLGIDYATQVCYSNQSQRFWIYDEVNARLINVKGNVPGTIQSEISNLRGLIRASGEPTLQENSGQLFLFYKGNGIYIFDYYGSLLRKFEDSTALKSIATAEYIYFLHANSIVRINRITGEKENLKLPINGVRDFKIKGTAVYLKNSKGIMKYYLITHS